VDRDEDFSAYVDARGMTLVRSAVLMGCSLSDAEDLVQTALMRCYASWDKVVAARDSDAYVFRVLLNCRATGRRRRWSGETPTADLPERATSDRTDQLALGAAVSAAMRGLAYEHRCVLVLRYFVDLTEQQIAQILSIPVGTVKSRLSRAHTQLSQDRNLANLLDTRSGP